MHNFRKIEVNSPQNLQQLPTESSSIPLSNEELNAFWDKVLKSLHFVIGDANFNGWLKDLKVIKLEDKFLHLEAQTRFIKDWVEQKYCEEIIKTCLKFDRLIYRVEIKVAKKSTENTKEKTAENAILSHLKNQLSENPSISEISDDLFNKKFNLNHNFDNFLVSKSNQLAFTICKKIAESGKVLEKINPLYLYGLVGNGKTHLLHSIRNHIVANKPEVKIEYFSIERFIFNFVKSLQNNQIMHFKEKFKNIDILLIDDFQFINGKKGTQEEFLHIFNMLVNNGTQVILAGDRAPSSLNDINEAVKSRISGGLVVDIMPADYELRLQFAKQKLVSLIDDAVSREEIAKLMAEKITTSMRELEGAINKIKLNVETFGLSLSKESIILLLQESIISSHKPITIENIKKKVCEFYNISVADLNSLKRSRNIAKPRHVAMYLARKHTSLSLPEIGRNFGGKDHTSVMHAVKKIEENFKTDLSFQSKFRDLERGLRF